MSNKPSHAESKNKFAPFAKSDKSLPTTHEVTNALHLHSIVKSADPAELRAFIKREHPSKENLNQAVSLITANYAKDSAALRDMISVLLASGADVDGAIELPEDCKVSAKEIRNVTLLMFAIIINDLKLVNLVLEHKPDLEKADSLERTAVIYALIYDQSDSTTIMQLLIEHGANINYSLKLEMNAGVYEYHSAFTIACFKDLPNIVRLLLDNFVNVNFTTEPNKDTGLHLAVLYAGPQLLNLLLHYNRINVDALNRNGKKPYDLLINSKNYEEMRQVFNNFYNKFNSENSTAGEQNTEQNNNKYGNMQNNMTNNMSNNMTNNMQNNMTNYQKMPYPMNYNIPLNMVNMQNMQNMPMNQIPMQSLNNPYLQGNNFSSNSDLGDDNDSEKDDHAKNSASDGKRTLNKLWSAFYSSKRFKAFSNKLQANAFNYNLDYNLEVPVDFVPRKASICDRNYDRSLKSFVEAACAPTLYIDLGDPSHQAELKIKELEAVLLEKKNQIANIETELQRLNVECDEKSREIKKKEENLSFLKEIAAKNENKLSLLEERKKELIGRIPADKISHRSNKNIGEAQFLELKFAPPKVDENFITQILQKDLVDYQTYIQELLLKKQPLIENLIENIKETILQIDPNYEVRIFGSFATSSCLPWSNLDIVLVKKNKAEDDGKGEPAQKDKDEEPNPSHDGNGMEALFSQILKSVRNKKWLGKQFQYFDTPFQFLRLVAGEEYGKILIDISLDGEGHYGLKRVELVKSYLKEYAVLQPLIFALKTILKNANLNVHTNGGLSSYGLILMIVSYIQSKIENQGAVESEPNLVGKTFLGFLYHYGVYFDFNKYVILTYPLSESSGGDKETPYNFGPNTHELMIVDPLNNQNNVAKGTYQFMNLKMAFMIAYMVTKEDCECGCHFGKTVYEHTMHSTEHSLLKRMFNSVKRFSENK